MRIGATEQARLIREGEASPSELLEEAIGRLEDLNPRLNAVIHPLLDQARQGASGELPGGPFRGVPFLVKDLDSMLAGAPYTLLKGAIYIHPTLAEGLWTLMEAVTAV